MLQMGIKPLCVTATTCDLTSIGRKNIQNIKSLGVDYIEFTPNPSVRKQLNRIGLQEVGDISWPEHLGIFTIPVQVAVNYNIPLIVWGENSQNEYGGPAVAKDSKILDRQWLEEFGGLLGLRTRDISDSHGIDPRDLMPYTYPTDEELKKVGVSGIFYIYSLGWPSNALISKLGASRPVIKLLVVQWLIMRILIIIKQEFMTTLKILNLVLVELLI